MTDKDLYRTAGVDIAAGNEAAKRYGRLAAHTSIPGVLGKIGGFAGGFQLDLKAYPEPVLFSGTDGVGTKLKLAFATGRHDTIGIDCVAMCVNDVLTVGAKPLFFLDYLATGKLNVDVAEQVVAGVAAGCQQAGCALIGGETAEMPGMYADGEYDIAGFVTGVANQSQVIDGHHIQPEDVVLGLASSGLHSNGFSLVRKVVEESGLSWNDKPPFETSPSTTTLAEVLLTPTRIYVKSILQLLPQVEVLGMAHITGGGLVENLPRILPEGLGVDLDRSCWDIPPVFDWLEQQTKMAFESCARVWNMGIGYVLIVRPLQVKQAVERLAAFGEDVRVVGRVVSRDGVAF